MDKVVATYETFFSLVGEFLNETPIEIYDSVADSLLAHIFKNISERRGGSLKRRGKIRRVLRDVRLVRAGVKP